MFYNEKIETQAHLKNSVLCYWQMNGYIEKEDGINTRHLPKGQSLFIFNYGDNIELSKSSIFISPNQSFFVVPAITSSRIINQKGKIDLFGISFIGDGLFKLLQKPISQLISNFPKDCIEKYEKLQVDLKEKSFRERIEIIETFLNENLNQELNSPPLQNAIKFITKVKGVTTVKHISSRVHISERQLQRLFKKRIGISPKDFCKIVRVNNYIEFALDKGEQVDWMELVVKFNYHDQPHLINEVKSISKLSPNKLLNYRDTLYHRYSY